jgi:hypothetical protein
MIEEVVAGQKSLSIELSVQECDAREVSPYSNAGNQIVNVLE